MVDLGGRVGRLWDGARGGVMSCCRLCTCEVLWDIKRVMVGRGLDNKGLGL